MSAMSDQTRWWWIRHAPVPDEPLPEPLDVPVFVVALEAVGDPLHLVATDRGTFEAPPSMDELGPDIVLAEYAASLDHTSAAERRPSAKDVLEKTSGVTEIVVRQDWAARLLRDRVAVPLLNRGWMQRLIAEKVSQLQVSYRRGPLGAGHWRRLPGLRPGDRVPDRVCTRADGTTVRLHAALGPGWALLGPEWLAAVARARLGDVVTLRGNGDAMLVRPDGHLGWRGTDPAALTAWLDTALGGRTGVLTS